MCFIPENVLFFTLKAFGGLTALSQTSLYGLRGGTWRERNGRTRRWEDGNEGKGAWKD